jgi:hypothetical protein
MSEIKSVGQKNFEAYKEAVGGVAYDNTPIPNWADLKPTIKAGWEKGGQAARAREASETVTNNMKIYAELVDTLNLMRQYKLGQDPDAARFYAVTLTHLEFTIAYMRTFVLTLPEIEASPQPVK